MNAPLPRLFLPTSEITPVRLPLHGSKVPAGFPSPADDYVEARLSLDEYLIPHREATFFVRAEGNSMVEAGIHSGDLLVVDKSLDARSGDIVVAVVDGEFTVKTLLQREEGFILKAANPQFRDIEFREGQELVIWGVVTAVIKQLRR